MIEVSVTTFRNNIPDFINKVRNGEDVSLTSRGKVIARLVPPADDRQIARQKLDVLRTTCHIGDVLSPLGEEWKADHADT